MAYITTEQFLHFMDIQENMNNELIKKCQANQDGGASMLRMIELLKKEIDRQAAQISNLMGQTKAMTEAIAILTKHM